MTDCVSTGELIKMQYTTGMTRQKGHANKKYFC